jgi:hypothetical protein
LSSIARQTRSATLPRLGLNESLASSYGHYLGNCTESNCLLT